jgi:ABC-2 type transport system permease protein
MPGDDMSKRSKRSDLRYPSLPLFFLSGALYPITDAPRVLQVIASLNPISYAVDALRVCLLGFDHYGLPRDFAVLSITLVVLVAFGSYRFTKIEA